jgi:hypothetical protein
MLRLGAVFAGRGLEMKGKHIQANGITAHSVLF